MATLADGLAEQLKCPVCLEEYKNPILLRCYHSFCKRCVKHLLKRSEVENTIRCPQCRTKMEVPNGDVKALKSNFYINNLLDLMAVNREKLKGSNQVACEECDAGRLAAGRCEQCAVCLCPSCLESHSQDRSTQAHTIKTIQKAELHHSKEPKKTKRTFCTEHKKELHLFCQTCELFLCRDCMATEHWDHEYVVVNEALKPVRGSIDWLLVKCKVKIPAVDDAAKRVNVMKDMIHISAQDMASNIDNSIDKKIRDLNEKRENLKERVDNTRQEKLKQLSAQQEELTMAHASLTSGVEFTEYALEEGNEHELLSMKNQILTRLEELSSVEVRGEPCEWWNLAIEVSSDAAKFLDNVLTITEVEMCSDPGKSTLRMVGAEEGVIYNTFLNQSYEFLVTLKDKAGARLNSGGERVRVTIRTPEKTGITGDESLGLDVEVEVQDNKNGTHGFSFRPKVEGNHFIQVTVDGRPLSGNLVWEVEGSIGFGNQILDFIPLQSSRGIAHSWYNVKGGRHSWRLKRISSNENKPVEVGVMRDFTSDKWGWRDGCRIVPSSSDQIPQEVHSTIPSWLEGDVFVFYLDEDAGRFTIYSQMTQAREVFWRCPGTSARPYVDPPSYGFFTLDKELERKLSKPRKKSGHNRPLFTP